MQFIKDAGFGIQVAVLQGYLAAVGGHNVVKSMKALGDINKDNLKEFENYKHVGGRVLQTPFFLVGMAIGIVADLFSGLVNGARWIVQSINKAYADYKAGGKDESVESPDFGKLHSSLVNYKEAHTYCEMGKDPSETPIKENVTMFNDAVANAASKVCKDVATKLGFGGEG